MPDFTLHHGDCLEVLRGMADNSVDSIVTDPPYGLSFLGHKWDYDVPAIEVWAECLRVLKPGGHLLAFAGTRTQHRMAVRIEDAGFEIRDMLAWLYGSGFCKVGYIRGADGEHVVPGFGGSLKPALEPITMARKLLVGTVAANMLAHGTGGLNIDGCRVGTENTLRIKAGGSNQFPHEDDAWQPKTVQAGSDAGRWPANLLHDGSPDVVALFPATGKSRQSVRDPNGSMGYHGGAAGLPDVVSGHSDDGGSAARYFYCAKASKRDRDEGLDGFEVKRTGGMQATADGSMLTSSGNERTTRRANTHPTVKPTDLMRYLCRLVTPPGGVVLDPFMGSGSTGKAAMLEGFRFLGIEREAEYVEIARARIGGTNA